MARNRKALVTFTGVVAVFLALASVAYACVIFKGDLQIRSTAGNGNRVSGLGNGHGYCPGGGATTAAKAPRSGTVDVEIWPASKCSEVPGNYLGAETGKNPLDIRLRNVNAYVGTDGVQWNMIQGMGCWAGPNVSVSIGSMTVKRGAGVALGVPLHAATMANAPIASPAGTASNLCVGSGLTGDGIMAPLVIL